VGLYIGEYDVNGGGFVTAPVDQQVNLWSDNSWWSGVGEQEGSNSGYPLYAELDVDNDHFYEIWVWGGTDVYAGDGATRSGAAARAEILPRPSRPSPGNWTDLGLVRRRAGPLRRLQRGHRVGGSGALALAA
jgi:hypothetical protein